MTVPRVLLAEPDATARLRMIAALRNEFDVQPLGAGEDVVVSVRRMRPALVLLGLTRGRSADALRACRRIKTDSAAPPCVAIVDRSGRIRDPERSCADAMADGYARGDVLDPVAFARDTLAGTRPMLLPPSSPGPLSRLARRLRSRKPTS